MENNVLPRFDIKKKQNERKRNVCCCVFRENEAKRTRTKNKKSIVMSTMCYVIVAKQPQCYGNEWTNEQRTKSIIIYGKKFCFPTCECCFLAASALPSPSLPLPHCTSINTFRVRFSLSFIFFLHLSLGCWWWCGGAIAMLLGGS